MSFQEALNWHRQFSQETLDDRSALCEFVLNFYFQDIRGQGDKAELLQEKKSTEHEAGIQAAATKSC